MSTDQDVGRAIVGVALAAGAFLLLKELAESRGIGISDIVRESIAEHTGIGTAEEIAPQGGKGGRPKGSKDSKPRAPRGTYKKAPETLAS